MARADVLVSAQWAQENLDTPGVIFVEVDEDTSVYDTGHIPGAVKLDWKTDLQDAVIRDFVDAQQFSKLLSERGIGNDDTVVLYGGNNNWFAAYAYWYFKIYGHASIKLLDGGRRKWGTRRASALRGRGVPRGHQLHRRSPRWQHPGTARRGARGDRHQEPGRRAFPR